MNKFNIAIDGPAGAGKSTIARMVAVALGFIYVDTGAMYRAVTLMALERGLAPNHVREVIELARAMRIELSPGPKGQKVFVDGRDVSDAIRTTAVNNTVSAIAQIAEIRGLMVQKQKKMAEHKGVVMDGRDIGTQVLPDAEVKVFLTASVKERARRRFEELQEKGDPITIEQLERDIAERDRKDEQRDVSPLVRADDAVLIDSTKMSITEVAEHILSLCRSKVGGEA